MFKFENKLCPVCRERFREGDDIAVCPECGTPHHRACYLAANKCFFEGLHGTGYAWNGRLPDEPIPVPDLSEMQGACDADNASSITQIDDEKALTLLGLSELNDEEREEFRQVKENSPIKEILGTIGDNTKGEDGVSMQELIAFTGTSVWHYSRAFNSFRGMNAEGKKHYASFNLFSGLFSPIFQFYRKMDLLGVIVLLISVLPYAVILMTGGSLMDPIGTVPNLLLNLVSLASTVLLCVFGDYLFYLKAVRHIRKIRERFEGNTDSLEYLKALSEKGRPSLARAALGALAMILANACVYVFGGM